MKAKRTKQLNIEWSRKTQWIISFTVVKTRTAKKPVKSVKRGRPAKRKQRRLLPGFLFAFARQLRAAVKATGRALSATVSWLAPFVPYTLATVGLAGILFFGLRTTQVRAPEHVTTFAIPAPAVTAPKPEAPKGLSHSEPTHISIPSVGIDSDIMVVGRNDDGTMQTPPLFVNITGWYKYSPTPGEIGPSVIVGHIDTYKGPSVFWRLGQLQPGDIVAVTRKDGVVVKFRVEALKQFEQNDFPTAEVYGNLDHAGLRLITCGGTFNRATGHYSQNTVVFASIVTS